MRVAAVIVNWNQPALTRDCVASLVAGTCRPEWIITIDNGSIIDPTPMVRGVCAAAIVVRNQHNVGFAAAANLGTERALALGADAVLLINNDAVVDAACIGELAGALDRQAHLAAVGAKVLTQEQPPRIHTAYGVLTYHGWLVQQQGWLEPDVSKFNVPREVDYISGCAMLLRRTALERIGLLDPEFFAYHEDLDWCVRARRAGYGVAYIPSAVVYHRMHASTGGGGMRSPIGYLSARNSILFVRKNARWSERAKFIFYLSGHLLKESIRCWRLGEVAGYVLRLRGLWDGLLRRPIPLRELGLEPAAPPADRQR